MITVFVKRASSNDDSMPCEGCCLSDFRRNGFPKTRLWEKSFTSLDDLLAFVELHGSVILEPKAPEYNNMHELIIYDSYVE